MRRIDPKYRIEQRGYSPEGAFINDYQIVNPSGVPIPENEPLILFRARDRLALPMLRAYRALAVADGCTDFHIAGIDNRIAAFESFAIQYAERMKQPGITRGKMRRSRMKNPKLTPEQEMRIAERLCTRATILELGVGEFLKSHTPCAMDVEEARGMLSMSIDWRKESRAIRDSLDVNSRPGKAARSTGK